MVTPVKKMTRLTFSVFVLVFFFVSLPFANAQIENPTNTSFVPHINNKEVSTILAENSAQTLRDGQAAAGVEVPPPGKETTGCGIDPTCYFTELVKFSISVTFGQLFALILQFAGYLFEISVYLSVVHFSVWITGENSVITQAWGIIRDVVNIGVIFALLYISLQTIIGRGPQLRKIIVSVVIFGLLTNFSLLFAKSMIDVSNIVALNFYAAIKGGSEDVLTPSFKDGVAARIMNDAHFAGWFSGGIADTDVTAPLENGAVSKDPTGIVSTLLACIVMVMAAFVFFQMTFMIFGRAVYLLFSIILSPLMFAGPVLFKFEGQVKKWWTSFFEQVITAPIFFIILWVTLFASKGIIDGVFSFIGQMHSDTIGGDIQNYILAIITQVIAFGIMMAGLQMVLATTKQFSKGIGDGFIKYGSQAIGYGVGRPLGFIGRQTGGRIGRYMQQEGSAYQRGQEWFSKSGFSGFRAVGNLLKGTSNIVKDSSYEMQNASKTKVGGGVSQLLNLAGSKLPGGNVMAGVGLGTAREEGYEARKKEGNDQAVATFVGENEAVEKSASRKFDSFDNTLRYFDPKTNKEVIVTRNTIDPGTNKVTRKTVKEWDNEIKKANEAQSINNEARNKEFIETQRFEKLNFLDKLKVRAIGVIQGGSTAGDKRTRAISEIEKAKEKKTKEGENKKKDAEKLKKYLDTELAEQLKTEKLASEVGLSDADLVAGKHKDMAEEARYEAWEKIRIAKNDKLKTAQDGYDKAIKLPKNATDRDMIIQKAKADRNKAKEEFDFSNNAKKEITRLQAKVKAAEDAAAKK